MPWWITFLAVPAVLVGAGYAALAAWIWLNGPTVAAGFAGRRAAMYAEIEERKAKADA